MSILFAAVSPAPGVYLVLKNNLLNEQILIDNEVTLFIQLSLPTVFQKQEPVRQTPLVPTSAERGNPPQGPKESARDVLGSHGSKHLPLTLCWVRLQVSHRVVRTRGIRRALCCPQRWRF